MRTGYSQTNLLIRLETVLGKDELLLYEFLEKNLFQIRLYLT